MPKVFIENLPWTKGHTFEGGQPFPERWCFYCPGCALVIKAANPDYDETTVRELSIHAMNVRDVHRFNGNPDCPTFEPSIMYNFVPGHVCHSFVRDGRIQYLSDCTHPLAGQTIELPELPSLCSHE